jgi:hypothetical protein
LERQTGTGIVKERKMEKDNSHKKNILKECDVCLKPVLVDSYGGGRCTHCGWKQTGIDEPHRICYNDNFVSFNKARKLYKEGKPFLPSFEEFAEVTQVYNEVDIQFNGKRYGVYTMSDGSIEFFDNDNWEKSMQSYKSFGEFAAKANINDVLLKDMWSQLEKIMPSYA